MGLSGALPGSIDSPYSSLQKVLPLDLHGWFCEANQRNLKYFIEAKVITPGGIRKFIIQKMTAEGIDIIEMPKDKEGKRPFNVTFNFNNEFNIDSIIKGEVKLF